MSKLTDERALSSANDNARWRELINRAWTARFRTLGSALSARWNSLRSQTLTWLRTVRPVPTSHNLVSREPLRPPAAVNENERLLYETIEQALRANGYLR